MKEKVRSQGKFKFAIITGIWFETDVVSLERVKLGADDGLDDFRVTYLDRGHIHTERITSQMHDMLRGMGCESIVTRS